MPVLPEFAGWQFAPERAEPGEDVIGVGADLAPGTLLTAYAAGAFPMGLGEDGHGPIGWFSPDPRGVLPLDGLRVTRSLRKSLTRYRVSVDTAFAQVVAGCADPAREGAWITGEIAAAYQELHELGWAHSVEVWREHELVGGLYGVAVGGLFAGESMFHRASDASKVALVHLVALLNEDGDPRRVLDVQWQTTHLATLGVIEVPRSNYLAMVRVALSAPLPRLWR